MFNNNHHFIYMLLLGVFITLSNCKKQSPQSQKSVNDNVNFTNLEDQIYTYNNAFKYDSSKALLLKTLEQPNLSPENIYQCYILLSYTHKRLFDYPRVMIYLDSAKKYAFKSAHKDSLMANIFSQKALALFDIHEYKESDEMMKNLAATQYAYLDDEYKAKIIMQEAYIKFLDKDYKNAERKYAIALELMRKSSPCDLPMINAKQIELYGDMGDDEKIEKTLKLSLASADSCKIIKYSMYTYDMTRKAYEKQQKFGKAFDAFKIKDSLEIVYDTKEHLDKVKELELKYQTERKEKEIAINKQVIQSRNTFIGWLVAIMFSGIVLYLLQQRKRLRQAKENSTNFTKQLLETTEEERRRIASDLHDSIGHELLVLKSDLKQDLSAVNLKIDQIINEIRGISRNLHPVMFDKIGLIPNIEALIIRMQNQHNFMINTEIDYHNTLSVADELQLYRIIQEALSNIIKYANAHAAKISIEELADKICIEIKDNGKGFNLKETLNSGNAFGLYNIFERSRIMGGEAKIKSSEEGTVITINIPKKAETPELKNLQYYR
jgi:signal transduction histidine kinase